MRSVGPALFLSLTFDNLHSRIIEEFRPTFLAAKSGQLLQPSSVYQAIPRLVVRQRHHTAVGTWGRCFEP